MSKKEKKQKSKQAKPKANKPKSVETTAIADAPMLDSGAEVLGTLAADTGETADPPKQAKSRRKKEDVTQDRGTHKGPSGEETQQGAPAVFGIEPDVKPEPLRLPRGAFVGLRKSGGLNFVSREVVLYPDGRVAYDARGVPQKEYSRLRRVLNDGQVLSLRKLLDQTNFWQTASSGEQNPDAYAYEIAARLGQRSNEIEVFDGSLPESLQPLVERLSKLLPEE